MDGRFPKGNIPWNKGLKGVQIAWNKGRKYSKETREKIRQAKLGIKSPLRGRKRPDMVGDKNPNTGKFGKDHPKWTENKKRPFHKSIRQLFKNRQWRSDIFTRDDFTCVLCGKRGVELQADHFPKSFINLIEEYRIDTIGKALECEELWNINNGRTLCVLCHRKTNTWGRRKAN